MTTFSAIDIGRTGVGFAHHWMDAIAHNMSNVNTVRGGEEEPFRARVVVARSLTEQIVAGGSGVAVREVREREGDPTRVQDPAHPLADEAGYVTMPHVDLSTEMTNLMIANRTYQANLKVIETGREAYQAALRIGQ
jgi:flagellar basal-body rod protein FlgC